MIGRLIVGNKIALLAPYFYIISFLMEKKNAYPKGTLPFEAAYFHTCS